MKGSRALLYVACFAGLSATSALVAGRVTHPAMTAQLLGAVALATLAGGPGLVRRRAWPIALVLLPIGAYVLARALMPVPPQTVDAAGHLGFYAEQIRAGAGAYARDVFPLDVAAKADLRLLLSLVVYTAVGAAALLGLSLRRPLPAIAVLLVLAGFGYTTDESAREVWSAIAFLLLAGGMLALSRALQRERWRPTDALAGGVTATLAALLALSILGTTMVEASRPLRDWRTWDIVGPGTTNLRFDWMQDYPRLLDPDENARVMRVRSPVASYWRANVLSDFTGTSWLSGGPDARLLVPLQRDGIVVYEVPPLQPAPRGSPAIQHFELESTVTSHLFAGGTPTEVRLSRPAQLRLSDAHSIGVEPPLGPTLDYTVEAIVPRLEQGDLVGRGRSYPRDVQRRYTALPFPSGQSIDGPASEAEWRAAASATAAGREWVGLYGLNAKIVGGETDPYRIALAIEQYLRSRYTYSLQPPSEGFDSKYAEFLFATGVGYCQHFAGAMAALLRFNGIPARVAVGFTSGDEEREGVFVVSRNDAHSWVEAYFPGVGWAPFDPTPGRRVPSAGDAPASGPDAAAAAGLDGGDATSEPVPQSDAAGRTRGADPGGASGQTVAPEGTAGGLPWGIALVVVLSGWPAGRALLRRRGLHRGTTEARVRASISLLYADLRDSGVEVPPSQTLDETASYLESDLGLTAGELMGRVQAVAFGGREATAADLEELAALRRQVRKRLRARGGRLKAVLALYGIRPASRGRPIRPALAAGVRGPLRR
jgi:transglutaminase-like putative cysteine protease